MCVRAIPLIDTFSFLGGPEVTLLTAVLEVTLLTAVLEAPGFNYGKEFYGFCVVLYIFFQNTLFVSKFCNYFCNVMFA